MTDDEPKYLVCPTPTWVGHTPKMNVPMTALQMMREVRAGRVVFEALGFQPVRVYGDFEKRYATMEAMQASRDAELQRCVAELTELNGQLKNIVILDSCGYKVDPDPAKCGPQLSWHFILPGKGAYACPADVKRAGLIPFRKDEPSVWDQGVFPELGSQRLMRTLGANKPGENRPFLMLVDGKLTSLEELYGMGEEVALLFFKKALIQNVDGETHYAVEKKEAPVVEIKREENGKVVALGANGKPYGSDVKIVCEKPIRELCTMCGWFGEFNRSHQRWCDEMWMLQNIADDLKLGNQLDQLMMDVSKVWIGTHTDASVEGIRAVTKDRPTDMRRKNLGQLRDEAETKDPIAYGQWYQKVKTEKQLEDAGGDKRKASIARLADTELNDADVAEVLIDGGWLDDYTWDYVQNVMYVWNGVHWKPSAKDILITLIQVELYSALEAYARSKWTAENTNPCKCIGAIKRLRNSRSTDGIIKSTCGLLMRKRPIDNIEWDNIPFKIAFDNGVLNLTSGIFEEGKKEDYLTMTTGWSLPLEVNMCVDLLRLEEDKRVTKLSKLYEKIQPNAEIRDILWQIMGSCLVGRILENVFIWTGEGRNGKSVSTDLLKSVLGQFAYRGDDATIQRDNGSATNQAVANMRNKRLTLFAEPHEGCKLKTSILKDLTGSSETHARALYATNTSIRLTHKLLIECNGGVNYDKVDQAIEKRTIIVAFPSLFTTQQEIDALPPGTENIYLVNPKYKSIEWQRKHRVAVLLKMIDGLRAMMAASNGQFILSKIPEVMRAVKHEFLENSDEIGSWFFEAYQPTEEKGARVTMKDVFEQFLQSRTYSNFSKQERREKGKKQYLSAKLLSNPKIKPFYRERVQPRKGEGEGQANLRSILIGFERVSAFG